MKTRVGVIYGGNTVEHEISVITAVQAMEYIDEDKYEIVPIYISKEGNWYTGHMLKEIDIYKDFENLKKFATKGSLINENGSFVFRSSGFIKRAIREIDVAFPIVHGKNAEDGSLAGYLNILGIPTVGPNVLGAAIGQDKVVLKQILNTASLPTPKYVWFYDSEYYANTKEINKEIAKLKYPVIVKPASLGSSIGIKIVKSEEHLEEGIMEAIKYDTKIIVEEVIPNLVEVNCAVYGNYESQTTSLIAEMKTKNDFLTYDDKYGSKGSKKTRPVKSVKGKLGGPTNDIIIPAPLTKTMEEEIYKLSKETFKLLNLSGVARIDFLVDSKTKKVYINEPNTIPGSLSFYMFKPKGIDYPKLLDELITIAIKDFKKESGKISSFDTNILSSYAGYGSKGLKGSKNKLGSQ